MKNSSRGSRNSGAFASEFLKHLEGIRTTSIIRSVEGWVIQPHHKVLPVYKGLNKKES